MLGILNNLAPHILFDHRAMGNPEKGHHGWVVGLWLSPIRQPMVSIEHA